MSQKGNTEGGRGRRLMMKKYDTQPGKMPEQLVEVAMKKQGPWREYWYGKNVLITGGNGFVASNLALKLLSLGANIHLTVRHYSDHNTIGMLSDKAFNYDIEMTDMTEYANIKRILDRHQIDSIFHLAASAIVSQASDSPAQTLYNNIVPTINILEAARTNGVKRLIIASTDKSYGDHSAINDPERIPYRESYTLRGLDVYSTSKVCTDMIAQTIALQYKQPILVTRCCNIFGPGDFNLSRVVPKTIMRLLSGAAPVINSGNSHVLREYVFVDDVADAYIFLAEHMEDFFMQEYPQGGKAYGWPCFNIGSYSGEELLHPYNLNNIKNVKSLIAIISEMLEKNYAVNVLQAQTIPKSPSFIEIPDQYIDGSKLHHAGFVPKTNLKDGLERTIKWYYDHFDFFKKYGAQYLN
jgi:CDP-glucose 4,6-dehydratase